MKSNVIFEQATIGRNENCIALYRHDGEISDADIFQFGDESAFATANEICDELDDFPGYNIETGEISGCTCFFLTDDVSNDAKYFFFKHDRDLATACEMAERFKELDDEDDDETADE